MENLNQNHNDKMYKAIMSLKDIDECRAFFEDVCAMSELHAMEQRFEVADMLKEEKVYTEIMKETGASSATVSRVKRMLFYGTGCLSKIIDRVNGKEE